LKSEIYTSRYYLKIQFLLHSAHYAHYTDQPVHTVKKIIGLFVRISDINKLCGHKACIATLNKGVKGKGVPLQAWSGPEGSRKLRFPDFMATA
jgi:hypothetical protein